MGDGLISLGASRKTLIPLGENKTTTTDLEPDLKHALFKNTVLMSTHTRILREWLFYLRPVLIKAISTRLCTFCLCPSRGKHMS